MIHPLDRLRKLSATPGEIAGGFSIGVFLGFTPLFGLKTLLAFVLAIAFRVNKPAAIIGVTLHDLATPFIPILLRTEYDVGFWLVSHPHHFPPSISLHHISLHDMLSWTTFFATGGPLLLGSLVIGLPVAVVTYFAMIGVLQKTVARQ